MTSRKIFNHDNLKESKIVSKLYDKSTTYNNSISACGCLLYKILNDELLLLLISYKDPSWPKLDDFGGRVDDSDKTVYDTISRETSEETNGVITKSAIKKLMKHCIAKFYNKQAKYFSMLIEVNSDDFEDTLLFGDTEITDNIERTIKWHAYSNVKTKLAHRLLNNSMLIQHLDELNNSDNSDNSDDSDDSDKN